MIKNLFFVLLLMCFSSHLVMAQPQVQLSDEHRNAMSQLEFLIGQWEGEGWMMTQSGTKETFKQTEHIQWKLDKSLILVEGKGMSEEEIVHNALALISFDPNTSTYRFQSHLANGRSGEYTGEMIEEDAFRWTIEVPGRTIRYTITLNDQGQWFETGEFKMGEQWMQFFEMTLEKK